MKKKPTTNFRSTSCDNRILERSKQNNSYKHRSSSHKGWMFKVFVTGQETDKRKWLIKIKAIISCVFTKYTLLYIKISNIVDN